MTKRFQKAYNKENRLMTSDTEKENTKKNNIKIRNIKKKLFIGIAVLATLAGVAIPVSKYADNTYNNKHKVNTQNVYVDAENIENTLQVHFIDVGQGDSILLRQNGDAMLIDAGERGKGNEVVEYCKREGISELKYVLGTHMHEDHIGGISEVIDNMQVDNVILTKSDYSTDVCKNMINVIRKKNVNEIYPDAGDTFSLGNADILVTAPNRNDYKDENNNSIILRVTYGDVSYLFCGDAEIESEYDMAENGMDISAQVIKIGHHGSDTSTSQMLLNVVNPVYAVISVGKDNDYGHPTSQVISRLEEYGIQYFRTDMEGTIVSVTDGKNIMWSSMSGEKTDYGSVDYNKTDYGSVNYNNTDYSSLDYITTDNDTTDNDNKDITYDYVVNKNTKKFHKPDCELADDILDKNKENYSGDRENLIKEGYAPCKKCNP